MKKIFILLLICFNLFSAETILDRDKPRIILESISQHAIRIGEGEDKIVYIFVDPKCKFSKRIMTKISENKMLQLVNSYYVFLYKLPRLHSDKLIQYIYQSDDQKSTLLEVMVDEEIVDLDDFETTPKTIEAIKAIAQVAKKFNMKVRPYMISFERDSKFCTLSEGELSCMEEFED